MMVGMTVVIENDPSWLDYLIAIGTVGAAAFAAYAALVSRRAAAAAIDLVRVESGRDTRAADERCGARQGGSPLTVVVDGPPDADVNGWVFFKDVEGRAWIASATDPVEPAKGALQQRVEEGKQFAEAMLSQPDLPDERVGHYTSQILG